VDEDWVRSKVEGGGGEEEEGGGSEGGDSEGGDSEGYSSKFKVDPGTDFIRELLWLCPDGRFPRFNKKFIGTKLRESAGFDATGETTEDEDIFTVTAMSKTKSGSFFDYTFTLTSVSDPSDIREGVDEDTLTDGYEWIPEDDIWERYQAQVITEGVWEGRADPSLEDEINRLVDSLAAAEPVDYHPGTREIVRDLVHPSLYPLLSDPARRDVTRKNFWGRPHELSRFQWLPSEVRVESNGRAEIVSDINNLDRAKYGELYDALGRLFTTMVPGLEKVALCLK
jgi:hypothetical protein